MMNALILTKNQTHFLQENRQDPITGDSFSLGDEIVFCASCKSAFLKQSWEFMGEKHCNQYKTLNNFPISERLFLSKSNFILSYIKAETSSRVVSTFIDAFLVVLFIMVVRPIISNFDFESNFIALYIGLVLFIFRDTFFLNQSIGKRMMKLYFIDSKTKQNAIWYRVFARNLIWWLINGLLYGLSSSYNFAFTVLSIVILNTFYIFYMIFNGESFIDEWLEIELVEEIEIKDTAVEDGV